MDLNSSTIAKVRQSQPIAPEDVPTPRFSSAHSVEHTITNHSVLKIISKKYNTPVEIPDAPTIQTATSYYARLNTAERIEVDYGYDMQIDVQPDMRFAIQYITFTTTLEYPDLDIKGYSYISLPTLVG